MLDDFREWLSDNLRYILLGLAVILIVVIGFCVVKLIGGSSGEPQSSGKAESEISTEVITEAQKTQGETAESKTQGETAATGTESLVKDDAAILTLVKTYYTAAASKDVATLETILDPWNEEIKNAVLQNDVIESYNNISTYSKKGPVPNSYVVYAYYEGKVVNINTPVPSLSVLYVTTNASGNLVVADQNTSKEVADYIETAKSDADVQALVTDVNSQCENAKASDPALKEFMDSINSSDESGQGDANADISATGEMTATSELNIRQEPSTDSAIMGVIPSGTTITKIQNVEDGWCQISYNAGSYTIEGYVKSEYLKAVGTADTTGASDTADSTDTAADTQI